MISSSWARARQGSAPRCTPGGGCWTRSCWSEACRAASCSTPSGSTTTSVSSTFSAGSWPAKMADHAGQVRGRHPAGERGVGLAAGRRDLRGHHLRRDDLRGTGRDPDGGRHADQAGGARRAGVRRPRGLVLRGLRRRVLQGRDARGDRRRRRRGGGGGLPHPLRQQGARGAPARRVPRVEDAAGAALREPQDRGDLEQAGDRVQGRARRDCSRSSWRTP